MWRALLNFDNQPSTVAEVQQHFTSPDSFIKGLSCLKFYTFGHPRKAMENGVVSVIQLAIDLGFRIRDGYYQASKDAKNFRLKARILQTKEAQMRDSLQRLSLSNDKFIKPLLDHAEKLLKSELDRCKKKSRWSIRNMTRLIFPKDLSDTIDRLTSAVESLPKQFEDHRQFRELLESYTSGQAAELPFRKDDKYVPLAATIKEVREALESPNGGSVVTLYGGSGEGKTGLAKHLAAAYQDAAKSRELERSKVAFADGSFFLPCGPKADAMSLLVQLQQSLGLSIDGFRFQNAQDQGSASNLSFQISLTNLKSQLQRRLKDRKILIVLDDVWETPLVGDLIIPAAGLKYLITSGFKGVWPDGQCKIKIELPTQEEARQILAHHVQAFRETLPTQLEDGSQVCRWKIPSQLEDAVDQIIKKCQYNPLDIANVAISVANRNALDPCEWEIAKENLTDHVDGDPSRGPVLFDRSYSKGTLSNAADLAIKSFTGGNHETILCIAGLCETELLPEPLIKLFFRSVQSKLTTFLDCCDDLEGTGFIKREIKKSSSNVYWSIHSMRRVKIREKLADQIESIASKILDPPSTSNGGGTYETELLSALLFLYGRGPSQEKAIQKLNSSVNYASVDGPLISRLRVCMEPLIFLLDAYARAQGTVKQEVHLNSAQVIVHFVRQVEFHDEAMSKLLSTEKSASSLAVCDAIINLAKLVPEPLLTTKHHLTLKAMMGYLNRLCESDPGGLAYFAASLAVFYLLGRAVSSLEIFVMVTEEEKTLPTLVKLLQTDNNLHIRNHTPLSIASLCNSEDAKLKIRDFPGMVEGGLESLLLGHGDDSIVNPHFDSYYPSVALGALAEHGDLAVCEKVGSHPGALERLVRLLRHTSDIAQLSAVRALMWLCADVRRNRVMLGSCEEAVEGLVELLNSHEDLKARCSAAFVLGRLCEDGGDLATKVGSCEGAIEGLVKLLIQSQGDPESAQSAIGAIGDCASSEENRSKIGSCSGAVEGLVGFLNSPEDLEVRSSAAIVLARLCEDGSDNATKVGSCEGAIEGLVKLLIQSPANTEYQCRAASAIALSSKRSTEIRSKIWLCPGAVKALVDLLAEDITDPDTQCAAVLTFRSLIHLGKYHELVRSHPGAMERWAKLHSKMYGEDRTRYYIAHADLIARGRVIFI